MDNRKILEKNHFDLKTPEHNPDDDGEVFSAVFIPRGVRDVMLDYINKEINPIKDLPKGKSLYKEYDKFKFFGRDLQYFFNSETLESAADTILLSDEKEIPKVIEMIEKNPMLLHVKTEGIDPLGRIVVGTLLQIAAMCGDVNLKKGKLKVEDLSLVARLKSAGKLLDKDAKDQLEVITSDNAIKENERRNQLVISAMNQFMNSILEIKLNKNEELSKSLIKCKPHIATLERNLHAITNTPIELGYVFDPNVISKVALNFASRIHDFGGWKSIYSGIFRIAGYGLLQKQLSVRDAHLTKFGMDKYIEKFKIPPRLSKEEVNQYYHSGIGYNYYYNYTGEAIGAEKCQLFPPVDVFEMTLYETLFSNRNENIEKNPRQPVPTPAPKKSFWPF